MKTRLILFLIFPICVFSQIDLNTIPQPEYSKELAQFQSKHFVFEKILKVESQVVKFEVDPLSGAESGQLTTLYYNCAEQNKEGLILTFFGNYWNNAGVRYQGYGFKNFDKKQAVEFLDKIQSAIDSNAKFLKDNSDNNIAFKYDDIDIIITSSNQTAYLIRLFWNGFDSTWDAFAFNRSSRRLNYNLKNK
jgi:hypothetical protein